MGLCKAELMRNDISFEVLLAALLKMKTNLSGKRLLFQQVDPPECSFL
jgi:hypothetical protein